MLDTDPCPYPSCPLVTVCLSHEGIIDSCRPKGMLPFCLHLFDRLSERSSNLRLSDDLERRMSESVVHFMNGNSDNKTWSTALNVLKTAVYCLVTLGNSQVPFFARDQE